MFDYRNINSFLDDNDMIKSVNISIELYESLMGLIQTIKGHVR